MADDPAAFDDPCDLAELVADLPRPVLLAFDCDGVLAPFTDHADDSVLTAGVGDDLARLAQVDGITIAILSGRSLDGLSQFGFDDAIRVLGSYGAEQRGVADVELTDDEARRLRVLDELLTAAATRAGGGAWVERKPSSVVIHVREADPQRGREALEWALREQGELDGHTFHEGDSVLELMTRPADKGTGLDALRSEVAPHSAVYVGDDIPDEDAFARLDANDVGIKVGNGETNASHRVADPACIATLLSALAAATATTSA